MITDFAPSKKSCRVLIGKELLAGAALGVLYPFGIGVKKTKSTRARDQRTVVMIHGYGGNRSSLYPLAAYLRLRGIRKILFFDYSSRKGIESAAFELRNFLKRRVRGGRIDFVCHSMGGIVARTYMQLMGGARRIDRCIALGSPHEGTYNAYWLPNLVGEQLRPDSALMHRLRSTRSQASQVTYLSIAGGSDNIIIPRVFACSSQQESLHIADVGHLGLLVSKRVMDVVARCLQSVHNTVSAASS